MQLFFQILRILFLPALKGSFTYIKIQASGIPFRYLLQDVLSVLQKVGLLVFLALIASVIFLALPQGIDTMLVVVEDLNKGKAAKFIFLLLALFSWSIVSEFGIRYAIYVSDNSGKSLSDKRVAWKKAVQRIVAASCLLWPTLLIFISLIITLLRYTSKDYLNWATAFFCLYVLFCVLTNLYFYKTKSNRPNILERKFVLAPEQLPAVEQKWLGKLYGIYNDYVFAVTNAANFNPPGSELLNSFNGAFSTTTEARNSFPQSVALSEDSRVPSRFKLLKVTPEMPDGKQDFKWNYRIPINFYPVLHKQIKYVAIIALVVFLVVCFIPVNWGIFEVVGAPGLVCLAFACWIGIYIGVLYLDFAKLRRLPVSVRFLLFVLLLVSSAINNDHPLRERDNVENISKERPRLDTHFAGWIKQYKADMDSAYAVKDLSKAKRKTGSKLKNYPVIFICAEGGALRTGGFTALYLTRLQRALHESLGYDFKRSVYAMSGVSGGALGLGLFNAVAYVNKSEELINGGASEKSAQLFFEGDFIAPVIGKMFFGDLLNLFWPIHVNILDRAIAMEQAWENQYAMLLVNNGHHQVNNVFSQPFDTLHFNARKKPLIIFNTDEVETGEQCWLTNVKPLGLYKDTVRDLLNYKIKKAVNYSTSINFSTRFPLFSPGAMVKLDTIKLHYLDGGYVENTGAGSMLEVLELLRKDTAAFKNIIPMVIFLRFSEQSPTSSTKDNINFGNEVTEIFGGIYNARKGRSDVAVHQLRDLVENKYHGGVLDVELKANERAVPMNWILSNQSIEYIKKDIAQKINNWAYTRAKLQLDSVKYMPAPTKLK